MNFGNVVLLQTLRLMAIFLKVLAVEPLFREPYVNLTFVVGNHAKLKCTINAMGKYQLAWVKVDTQTILTLGNRVITNDPRIRVTQNNHHSWILHISDLLFQDRGYYMCQINTRPLKYNIMYLNAVVPPNIINEATSSDVSVKENTELNLHCRANGFPAPKITWRRGSGKKIDVSRSPDKQNKVSKVFGSIITIRRVQRTDEGVYICVASNGIHPNAVKNINVRVNFLPKIEIPNELVAAPLGSKVLLECIIDSSPVPATSWIKGTNYAIESDKKYQTTVVHEASKIFMKLFIYHLNYSDYGIYKCISSNYMGESIGAINLYETKMNPVRQGSRSIEFLQNSSDNNSLGANLTRRENFFEFPSNRNGVTEELSSKAQNHELCCQETMVFLSIVVYLCVS